MGGILDTHHQKGPMTTIQPDIPEDDGIGDLDDFDEEFADDGADGTTATSLAPMGPSPRPNGQMYLPRMLGDVEDLAFIRHEGSLRKHTLLYGPPGTGKTALAEAACFPGAEKGEDGRYTHLGFFSLVVGVDTEASDFFGSFVQDPETGKYVWNDGPLLLAFRYNVPLYVDEIFLCDTRVLSATLYPAMDGRTTMTVPMNPSLGSIDIPDGFYVIAAGNPNVPGASYSEALRSRMNHQIEVTTDWDLAKSLGVPPDVVEVSRALDEERAEGLLTWSPQLRDLLEYRDAVGTYGQAFAVADLLGKTPFDDRDVTGEALSKMTGKPVRALRMGRQCKRRR